MAVRSPNAAAGSTTAAGLPLAYNGGTVSTASPKVVIVVWGSQWGSAPRQGLTTTGVPSGDASGEVALQQQFFSALGGSGDTWSTSTTQYCQTKSSAPVLLGSTSCPTGADFVADPAAGSVYLGTYFDTASRAPKSPTQSQLAAEAAKVAQATNLMGTAQYVVDTASHNNSSGFGRSFCAWHSSTVSGGTILSYTNMPYITDAGSSCGAGMLATSAVTTNTEGVTIVGGHEYAETITDLAPNGGWLDSGGAENGDKCAWRTTGNGSTQVVTIGGQPFAVQGLWSNNFPGRTGGDCAVAYNTGGTVQK